MLWLCLGAVTSGAFLAGVLVGARKSFPYYLLRSLAEPFWGSEAPATDEDRPNLLMVGDSLVARGDWRGLEREWDVLNFGRGGRKVAELVGESDYLPLESADAIVFWCGVNDLRQRRPVAELIKELEYLLGRFGGEAAVIVLGIPEVRGEGASTWRENARLVNGWLREYCAASGLVFIDPNELLSDASGLRPEYSRDGVHLLMDGYAVIREQLSDRLDPLDLPTVSP